MLDVLSCGFQYPRKVLSFHIQWLPYTLNEGRPIWIYSIREVVSHVVRIPIDREGHGWLFSVCVRRKNRRAVEDIDVIIATGHAKESVPDPQIIRCNRLEYHGGDLSTSSEHALPCSWTVPPLPVHTV